MSLGFRQPALHSHRITGGNHSLIAATLQDFDCYPLPNAALTPTVGFACKAPDFLRMGNSVKIEMRTDWHAHKSGYRIRSRFEQSKAAILPIVSQIAFTDELIDQIVYRLYDLTPDEIKIGETANI